MKSASALYAGSKTDFRSLARILTYVENDHPEGRTLLKNLEINNAIPIIGVTGAPGAGKSTLIDAIAVELTRMGKRLAILAIDPTSPFNFGSLLGDRIRMSRQSGNEHVFIRSLATRGSLGGLSATTFELADVLRASGFDYIFIETVGVGQSELEIAGLADRTLLVMVPGNGDEVQMIKSGIMEIADAFVVNKSDREGADQLVAGIKHVLHERNDHWPVLKTNAMTGGGLEVLVNYLLEPVPTDHQRKHWLMAEKAWKQVEAARMRDLDKEKFRTALGIAAGKQDFNLYRFAAGYTGGL